MNDRIPPCVWESIVMNLDLTELAIFTQIKDGEYQETIYGIPHVEDYVLVERVPCAVGGSSETYYEVRDREWMDRVIESNDYRPVAILDDALRNRIETRYERV